MENYAFSARSKEIAESSLAIKIDSLKNEMGISTLSASAKDADVNLTFLIDKLKLDHPEYYSFLYGLENYKLKDLQAFCKENNQNWIIFFYKSDGEFCSMLVNQDTCFLSSTSFENEFLNERRDLILQSLKKKDWNFVRESEELYNILIRPLEDHFISNNLVFLPHGALLNFPFALLIDSSAANFTRAYDFPYLMKKYNISYNYSASLAIEAQVDSLCFSSPLFVAPTYSSQPLKYNQEELVRGRSAIGGVGITGDKTSKNNLLDHFAAHDHFHFAGHISSNKSIDSTYLLLGTGSDSLYLNEIIDLQSYAKLVVLSGCESALGETNPEAVISPAYGFTFAGSPNVISSMWKNNDESSSIIFTTFYHI